MRQLKFHERKLLKKVDFLQWKSENNHRELEVRYFRAHKPTIKAAMQRPEAKFCALRRSCGGITFKDATTIKNTANCVEMLRVWSIS